MWICRRLDAERQQNSIQQDSVLTVQHVIFVTVIRVLSKKTRDISWKRYWITAFTTEQSVMGRLETVLGHICNVLVLMASSLVASLRTVGWHRHCTHVDRSLCQSIPWYSYTRRCVRYKLRCWHKYSAPYNLVRRNLPRRLPTNADSSHQSNGKDCTCTNNSKELDSDNIWLYFLTYFFL